MKSTFFVTMAAFASLTGALAVADDSHVPAAVKEKVDTVCQSCHGVQGNSVSSTFPRLNGQQADYIAGQLKNFRDHSRTDPHARAYMWGMASQLDDATIDGLAKYFASQKPSQPQGGGDLAVEGKKIYMDGADAQNVPACQACHGEHGEGNSVIPRLAGQHRDYLKAQMEAFRSTLRESDIMHANTKEMTDRQIEALASYLAND
ncbi:MAG: c-type cytochrome [Rhizomicrobium sp.]